MPEKSSARTRRSSSSRRERQRDSRRGADTQACEVARNAAREDSGDGCTDRNGRRRHGRDQIPSSPPREQQRQAGHRERVRERHRQERERRRVEVVADDERPDADPDQGRNARDGDDQERAGPGDAAAVVADVEVAARDRAVHPEHRGDRRDAHGSAEDVHQAEVGRPERAGENRRREDQGDGNGSDARAVDERVTGDGAQAPHVVESRRLGHGPRCFGESPGTSPRDRAARFARVPGRSARAAGR